MVSHFNRVRAKTFRYTENQPVQEHLGHIPFGVGGIKMLYPGVVAGDDFLHLSAVRFRLPITFSDSTFKQFHRIFRNPIVFALSRLPLLFAYTSYANINSAVFAGPHLPRLALVFLGRFGGKAVIEVFSSSIFVFTH